MYTTGGENGRRLKRLLDDEGIENHPVLISGMTRENFMVYDEFNGQQYRFGMPGPVLTEIELKHLLDALFTDAPEADYIVASGSIPHGVPDDFYTSVTSRVARRGTRLISDFSLNYRQFAQWSPSNRSIR